MVEAVRQVSSRYLRNMVLAVIFFTLSFALWLNAYYILNQFKYVSPFSYLNGTLSRDQYINKYRPEYPVMQYINKNLPEDAKILFIYLGQKEDIIVIGNMFLI